MEVTIEDVKTITDILTPFLIALFGFLLLRRTEGIKTKAVRESDYLIKHADYFLTTAEEFIVAHEKALTLLTLLNKSVTLEEDCKNALWKKLISLLETVLELELRLRRYEPFIPIEEEKILSAAKGCNKLLVDTLNQKKGNVDPIIKEIRNLHSLVRVVHKEMLNLSSVPFWKRIF